MAILERAHRGAIEEQYAHELWLAHGLHRQSPMVVLLRGLAATYAIDTAPPGPIELGGAGWGVYPDYRAAIRRLLDDDARVLVSASALDRLGMSDKRLLPGLGVSEDHEITKLLIIAERILFL
ncbi:hypothetical protein AB0B85_04370 [Micromonospora sp. NPDC049044]|uniref:hypothetical protein n=1 Tax=Micromonospora sp. NPDC049044 TaxID=3154827 RepID=UPI0033C30C78